MIQIDPTRNSAPFKRMKNRIEHLLRMYLEGEEAEEDFRELMELIDSGAADTIITDTFSEELAALIEARTAADDWEQARLQEVFGRIKPALQAPNDKRISVTSRPPVRFRPRRTHDRAFLTHVATAAALLFIALTGVWFYGINRQALPASNENRSHSYTGAQQIALPDESVVLLNEGSTLTHKPDFGENNREVWLEGEGYFDVQDDPSRPFIVKTGDIITTVLGTSFNIKAVKGESEVTVTVTRGVVEVGDAEQTYGQLLADEQLAVNTITRSFEKSSSPDASALEWKNRFIVLDNIALADAAKIIGRRFKVRISIKNDDLRQVNISATFLQEEGLEHIIQSICLITRSSYTISGNHIEITGGLDMN